MLTMYSHVYILYVKSDPVFPEYWSKFSKKNHPENVGLPGGERGRPLTTKYQY